MKNNVSQKENTNISLSSGGLFYTTTILCYVVLSIFFTIVVSVIGGKNDVSTENWYLFSSVILAGVMLSLSIFIGKKVTGEKFISGIGDIKVKPIFYVFAVCIFFGMVFGLGETNNYFIAFLEKLGVETSVTKLPEKSVFGVIVVIVFVCIIPALCEEYIFRGVILKSLVPCGELFAIIISSLLFSFYHMNAEKTVYQFLAGVLFSLLAIKSNSILPSFFAHFLNNFIVVINYYFWGLNFTFVVRIVLTVVALIVLAITVFFLVYKSKFKKFDKSNVKEFFLSAFIGIVGALSFWIVGLF